VLYNHRADPPQQLRHRCRNPRCGGLLKDPTNDRRGAFCCQPCGRAHFATRCIVCEAAIAKTSRRRVVCWRSKCRHALQRHPEQYRLRVGQNAAKTVSATPTAGLGHNAQKNSAKSTLKTGTKSGRAHRIIAGPAADPVNFGNWPELPKPRKVLIGRTTTPVNVIGGYRFPGAPATDPRPASAAPAARVIPIGDGLEIPLFLKRIHDADRVPA
jgi:hypothetical protein